MDANLKDVRPPHPGANINIFEFLTFWWILKLFKKGQKQELEVHDLYTTLDEHKSSNLGNKLEKIWQIELDNGKKASRKPSLLRAYVHMFGSKLLLHGFLLLIVEITFSVFQPYCMGHIIKQFETNAPSDQLTGIIYGISLMATTLVKTFGFSAYDILTKNMGMNMRVSTCSLIYKKALRLSKASLGETTAGQVVNLLSNDVNRFDMAIFFLHFLWIGPLETIVVTYFLWQEIGVSSLIGIFALFGFIPLQGWLGKKSSEFRLKTAVNTDERLRLMNELISGIRAIKMYTWEKFFVRLVQHSRKKEIQQIKRSSYIKAIMLSFIHFQTRIALFLSIFLYVLLGNHITAKKVFVITVYYSILRITTTIFFPQAIAQIAEMQISIKRLQDFLLHGEKVDQITHLSKETDKGSVNSVKNSNFINDNVKLENIDIQNDTEKHSDLSLNVTNATAKWEVTQANNTLNNVTLTVKSGQLVAVVGPVGAGKSSLIQAILQELPLSRGKISVRGVVSYSSQEPWLFNSSVQQNILFGLPMDDERYKKVLKVCALMTDLKQFPRGDKTIVGERGVSLSGGQRARINLARAIYKQADIYLLDDPLSAVDTRVGKYLFEKCIKEYLKNKTCILITHQLQYLTSVDQIVLMENANVLAEGSYQQLKVSGFDFTKILGSSSVTATSPDNKSDIPNSNGDCLDNHTALPRQVSIESIESIEAENKLSEAAEKPNETAETRSIGNVSFKVYSSYFAANGSCLKILFLVFICVFAQALISGGDYWISFWVNLEERVFQSVTNNITTTTDSVYELLSWPISRGTCVTVFAVLTVSTIAITFIRSASFVSVFVGASLALHNKMFNAIVRATTQFFDTNASGRILNRFSKDIGVMDDVLLTILIDCIQMGLALLGTVCLVVIANIYLMIPTLIIAIIFYKIRVFYLSTSRSIKRLEGITRSPVVAHLNASLQGLTTIRAFEAEEVLSNEFDVHQDLHSSAWYLFITSSRAFGLWLDLVCLIYMCIVTFSFLTIKNYANIGNVGLAITQTIGLVGMVQWGVRQLSELENQMTSVERIIEYSNAPQESAFESPPKKNPPKEWPDSGRIVFKNFCLRYSTSSPYVLKNLDFSIGSLDKIGIVGRTGAGKSSLIEALFRLALNEGSVFIDDIEIHELGLNELRSRLSIIPQEPFLFSETMRKNLDPFDEYSDHALWNALDEVNLKEIISDMSEGLNSKISGGGSNFSIGQRQLICLARAILRNNKILVLDEATANVDLQTDSLIQNTIRNKFRNCTVLTIAHRLNTVMDSDKVLVLDSGKIVEFDHPYNLLKNKDGLLYKMVEQTGYDNANSLHQLAEKSHKIIHETNIS